MKSVKLTSVAVMATFAVLTIPGWVTAQEQPKENHHVKHHHYKLIDMGTLGGPSSIVNEVFYEIDYGTAGARMISDQGAVAGQADTSTPDPLCFLDLDIPPRFPVAMRHTYGSRCASRPVELSQLGQQQRADCRDLTQRAE